MNKQFSIGILGAAKIAKRAVIEPAKQLEDVAVLGIAASDSVRAEKFAQEFDIPVVFPSYEALVQSDRIDAVYIPLANHLHTPWILNAIHSRKPILVEKPICLSLAEFDDIAAAVDFSGVPVLEAVMVQHHPWQSTIQEIVETKRYGAIKSIRTQLTMQFPEAENQGNYRFSPEYGGGAFFDLGTYWLQFLQRCLGLQPEAISAQARLNQPQGIDLEFDSQLRFSNAAIAEFHCSFEEPFAANHWVELEQATITIRNFFRPLLGIQSMSLDIHHFDTGETEIIKFPAQSYYLNQLKFFLEVLKGNEPLIPLSQSRERVNLMEAIYQSAQRPVGGRCG